MSKEAGWQGDGTEVREHVAAGGVELPGVCFHWTSHSGVPLATVFTLWYLLNVYYRARHCSRFL